MATTRPFATIDDLLAALDGIATIRDGGIEIDDAAEFRGELIDRLVWTAVFGEESAKAVARWLIRVAAPALGAFPASIHELYLAAGRGEYAHATAPAINVRGLAYDMARTILRAAQETNTKIAVFELSRSEIAYTDQRPGEYASAVLGAAIKEQYQGPVFIQGDHYQANAAKFAKDPEGEIRAVRELAHEAIGAGYFNIDIDASTLVDLSLTTVEAQQEWNSAITAKLTAAIREVEPDGVTVSVGGEIGEVGLRNSTVEDLDVFMSGYRAALAIRSEQAGRDLAGISKISVQTGTTHGGVVLPDGSVAKVKVDFAALAALSAAARERYGMGGAVQHGASTLPEEAFNHFAEANAIEVHLATAFQNQLFDSTHFPPELKSEIYAYLSANLANERKAGQTDAQFYYTTRKKAWGPFKHQFWHLPEETRAALMDELEGTFRLVMERLGVAGSASLVDRIIRPVAIEVPIPAALSRVVHR